MRDKVENEMMNGSYSFDRNAAAQAHGGSGDAARENANETTGNHSDDAARTIADAVARRSYGKLVAFLAARTRDVAAAEDALSEALASALADWPLKGCPSNPEAWLLTVARRKLTDAAPRAPTGEAASAPGPLQAGGC